MRKFYIKKRMFEVKQNVLTFYREKQTKYRQILLSQRLIPQKRLTLFRHWIELYRLLERNNKLLELFYFYYIEEKNVTSW